MFWKNALKSAAVGRPWSLAARLTVWYAGSAFLVLLAASGFLYGALVTNLDREDDEYLADKVRLFRALLRDNGAGTALEREVHGVGAARPLAPFYVRIIDANGSAAWETRGMSAQLPSELFPAPVDVDAEPSRGAEI